MSDVTAICGADVFDGETRHENATLVVEDGAVRDVVPAQAAPAGAARVDVPGGLLAPGFVDLQVNGGGGVLFNDQPDVTALETICSAHLRRGTTALLPTLITDTPESTNAAIEAGRAAARAGVPGFLGLHLEGPHLSVAKKGAHDADFIRPMTASDLRSLVAASKCLPKLVVTLAPEAVSTAQIETLTDAGVVVSLGHSAATFEAARSAAAAGARAVTHLFNAMSPLGHRDPGLVGAALATGGLFAGLIADGHHVHPAAIAMALSAKAGPGRVFLVSDAMPTVGTDITSFSLNGRRVERRDGRLTLADGTLAGADLDMASAVRVMVDIVGVSVEEALRMAALYPAQCLGADRLGHLKPGAAADIVHLNDILAPTRVWVGGRHVYSGGA